MFYWVATLSIYPSGINTVDTLFEASQYAFSPLKEQTKQQLFFFFLRLGGYYVLLGPVC